MPASLFLIVLMGLLIKLVLYRFFLINFDFGWVFVCFFLVEREVGGHPPRAVL